MPLASSSTRATTRLLNEVIERWFDEALGTNFREMHLQQNRGVPARSIAVEFLEASRLGDDLDSGLQVAKMGRASLSLVITCLCAGEMRMKADIAPVCVVLEPCGAAPVPDITRERMAAFAVQ